MITIGICEDVEETSRTIYRFCQKKADSRQIDCEIREFADGADLMQSIDCDGCCGLPDILILDIEMPKISGIEIKNRLQAQGIDTLIIFVTDHEEWMQEAFGIHVLGFVRKRHMEVQLGTMLESALQMVGHFVMVEGIDSRDILYIRSEHVYSSLRLKNGQKLLLREGLHRLEELLKGVDFVRIRRNCLVNLKYVQKIEEKQIYISGEKLPVSVREWANVKKKHHEYCKKNARYC